MELTVVYYPAAVEYHHHTCTSRKKGWVEANPTHMSIEAVRDYRMEIKADVEAGLEQDVKFHGCIDKALKGAS